MAANARGSAAHTATRRRAYQNAYNYVTLSAFLDLASHCHSTSNVPKRYVQDRVAVPTTRGCTLRPEWQCPPHGTARSGPSGSAAHTATRRRAYRNGALRAEWQCRRVGGRGARRGRLRAKGHARACRHAGQGVCRLLGRRARGAQARPAARNMSGPSPAASPERCRRRCGPQAAPASRGPSRGRPIAPGAASAGSPTRDARRPSAPNACG